MEGSEERSITISFLAAIEGMSRTNRPKAMVLIQPEIIRVAV